MNKKQRIEQLEHGIKSLTTQIKSLQSVLFGDGCAWSFPNNLDNLKYSLSEMKWHPVNKDFKAMLADEVKLVSFEFLAILSNSSIRKIQLSEVRIGPDGVCYLKDSTLSISHWMPFNEAT